MKNPFEIILLILLVLLAAITAASETSIIAASRLKLRKLARDGSKRAKAVLKILEVPERFFGTILVANNIVDALIASIVTAIMVLITGEKGKGIFYATLIVTFVIIVSEVAAKTLAARHAERMALALARPIQLLVYMLSPVVKLLSVVTKFMADLIGGEVKGKPSLITEEEIKALLKIGEEEGVIHKEKYKMLAGVFTFSDALVKDVMVQKKDMVCIDINTTADDILDKALELGYSRLPVYRSSPDNIVGIVNMKDLLNLAVNRSLILLQDIIYPPVFVPANKKITELLREFQEGHTHLAIVVDSAKTVIGLVTIEDLLEEIVGEIKDEHETRHPKKPK